LRKRESQRHPNTILKLNQVVENLATKKTPDQTALQSFMKALESLRNEKIPKIAS
jgi:hypothetical protein